MGKHIYYLANGDSFEFDSYIFAHFAPKYKELTGKDYNYPRHINHRLDGPVFIWHFKTNDKTEAFYINGIRYRKEEYYNHPEVKKYMLLKALKELK